MMLTGGIRVRPFYSFVGWRTGYIIEAGNHTLYGLSVEEASRRFQEAVQQIRSD